MSISPSTAASAVPYSPQPAQTFIEAIKAGSYEDVQRLIQEAKDLNDENWCRWTPLHFAAESGQLEIAQLLLDSGARPDGMGLTETPLYTAMKEGHRELAILLLKAGADPNAVWPHPPSSHYHNMGWNTPYKTCPIHWATLAGDYELTEALLEKGAHHDVMSTPYKRTPLHHAIENKDLALVQLLVEHQADINLKDCENTPIMLASKLGLTDIVEELLELGASRPTPEEIAEYSPEIQELYIKAPAVSSLRALCLASIHRQNNSETRNYRKPRVDTSLIPPLLFQFSR